MDQSEQLFPLCTTARELERLSGGRAGIAYDLDDTVYEACKPFIIEIVKQFREYPECIDPNAHHSVCPYATRTKVPPWDKPEVQQFIQHLIRSHKFHLDLPVIEEARTHLLRIHEHVPTIAYISTRPSTVAEATQQSLAKHNFPPAPILLKPPGVPSAGWKAGLIQRLCPLPVRAIVDNDPAVVPEISEDEQFPGLIVLHRDDASHIGHRNYIVRCKDWQDIAEQVLHRLAV